MANLFTLAFLGLVLAMSRFIPTPPEPPKRSVPPTRYERLWDSAEINPAQVFRIDKAIGIYLDNRSRYQAITDMRTGGVPAPIVFVFHGRESTWNFRKHLHEGSWLSGRTKWVPKGRPRRGSPPFSFEESAEDALYLLKDLESKNWTTVDSALNQIERYNGTGYLRYHPEVNSPYLWSGTNHYTRGKYVADGKFSRTAVDGQLGTVAILKRMADRGMETGFH